MSDQNEMDGTESEDYNSEKNDRAKTRQYFREYYHNNKKSYHRVSILSGAALKRKLALDHLATLGDIYN